MVLDKSGSMASSTMAAVPQPKIVSLQKAVKSFVDVWDSLRQLESDIGASARADKIGVVLFDSTAEWWGDPALNPGLTLSQDLNLIDSSNNPNVNISSFLDLSRCTATSCGELVPGTSTSVGAGLVLADDKFGSAPAATDGHRHVVLVMTDGIQNTNPMVRAYDPANPADPNPANPTQIATYSLGSPAVATPLPHTGSYQVFPVTVGTAGAVDTAFASGVARIPGSFYINTEGTLALSPIFLEILQNFIKFFSYETVRIISEPTPYSVTIPISTTSQNVVFTVMWPSQSSLRLIITPPGGVEPIVRESGSGFMSVVQRLPLPAPFDPREDWEIKVEEVNANVPAALATTTTRGGVMFDLHVMTDDGAIKTDLAIVPGDYKPGDKIRLRAKLTRFGLPILGLGSRPGDKIEAELIRPGKSIGDILSESTASSVSSGPDPQSPAEAKLDNTLRSNPSVLRHKSNTIQLYDDGKPEHGDDVAGDGIYNALYEATLPGHYNFTLAAESVAPDTVRFSRQQLRTVYVRPYPNADNTDFQSSISFGRKGAANTLSIVMTPRTKAGDHMGPAWANYFWFSAPGVTPFKAKDNLDGTYTATLAFTGAKPPKVSVGFEDALVVIADSVTFNELPAKPTPLVDYIPGPPGEVAIFLDLGAGFPHGTFSNAFNTGFSLNAGLEYMINSHFSVEGIFGYHHFAAKSVPPANGQLVTLPDLNLYQFSGNVKVYLVPPQKIRPFANGGIGGYKFSPGSGNFGGNFGGGLLYELTSRFGLQGSYNFHAVNTTGGATKFSTIQAGIRYVF
ncbi:MAG TPA: outer membrane beta-barrel protein [Candidatus Angelobacter sp.]